jgi:CheY-like chemotaxis protein
MAEFSTRRTAVFVGLDPALAAELSFALRAADCRVVEDGPADITFCPSNPLMANALCRESAAPVVVVSRLPDYQHWIDSLEAGAADYIAAPFEPAHIRWLLETHLGKPQARAASA